MRSGEPLATTEVAVAQADILVQAHAGGSDAIDWSRIDDCQLTINGVGEMTDVVVAMANELDERWLRPQLGNGPVLQVGWYECEERIVALGNTVLSYAHSRGPEDRKAIDVAAAQAGQQTVWDVVLRFAITLAQLRAR